ncbi:MAG: FkbM family methyltransferase [Pirellulales bacterium]
MEPFPAFNRQRACRYGQMLYNTNDMYVGRSLELYGEFSEGEIDLFRQVIHPGNVVIEVGANIGSHTVFLAQQVGRNGLVVAFEPQRIVFQTLCANLALNSITNVVALHQAVGSQSGEIFVPQLDCLKENNFGGLSLGEYNKGEIVSVVQLDCANLPRCDFIKVDVEGMEEDVLRGAAGLIARFQPVMYVENDRQEKSDSLVRYIDSLGYRMAWHRPPLYNPQNFLGNAENIFCRRTGDTVIEIVSANMLCVPKASQIQLQGFPPVEVPPPPTPPG